MDLDEPAARAFLEATGAASIAHPGGTLLDHLHRTAARLASWGASRPLVRAGLCHAAYGTDGFDRALLDPTNRSRLAAVIGPEGEDLVFLYGSCDREFTYHQLAIGSGRFRDRFTGIVMSPEPARLDQFMELTLANELDIVSHDQQAAKRIWPALTSLVECCHDRVSIPAWNAYLEARSAGPTGGPG